MRSPEVPPRLAAEPPATRRRYCAQRSAAAGEAVICPRRGIFWPLGDLNARKTTHIRAKPFEPAPSKGPFSLVYLPRGRGTQSLSRAARNDAAGTVLCFRLMPCCCLGGFRPMGFCGTYPRDFRVCLRARKGPSIFFVQILVATISQKPSDARCRT